MTPLRQALGHALMLALHRRLGRPDLAECEMVRLVSHIALCRGTGTTPS